MSAGKILIVVGFLPILIDRGIRRAFGRSSDPRRLHQVRVMATIAVQLVAAGLIAFGTYSLSDSRYRRI